MGTDDLGRLQGLSRSPLAQRLARAQRAGRRFALLSLGGHHQHHPVPVVSRLHHGSRGSDGLIVGMGVEIHHGAHYLTAPDS